MLTLHFTGSTSTENLSFPQSPASALTDRSVTERSSDESEAEDIAAGSIDENESEARILAACEAAEDSVTRLYRPKGDWKLSLRLFPDGWVKHECLHRWFGPEEPLAVKYWSAAEKKKVRDVFRAPYVPCLRSDLDADDRPKECPL